MPPFASPGHPIRLYAQGFEFQPGARYTVSFKVEGSTWHKPAKAAYPSHLDVELPSGIRAGPTLIRMRGSGLDQEYPSSLFTSLPPELVIPAGERVLDIHRFAAAVSADRTLLIPFDLEYVLDATQFAFQITNLAYEFNAENVIFYNSLGFDLTLFELYVRNGTQRQWGSYDGWQVEDDSELYGDVYRRKVRRSRHPSRTSDVLTYWRHEFRTYAAAHAPGGTHVVDENGRHPDGTFHVDHSHLVVAISGALRSSRGDDDDGPRDRRSLKPLSPGEVQLDVVLTSVPSEHPLEPDVILEHLPGVLSQRTTARATSPSPRRSESPHASLRS
jgi:hypothetical protein